MPVINYYPVAAKGYLCPLCNSDCQYDKPITQYADHEGEYQESEGSVELYCTSIHCEHYKEPIDSPNHI